MPKTLFQNVIFTLRMSFLMVYVMICYNICLNVGGMSNEVFLMAFGELKIMWPVAFVLEFVFVDKLAHMLAFRIVTPQDRPIFITLAISSKALDLRGLLGAVGLMEKGLDIFTALDMGITNKTFDTYEQTLIRDTIRTRISKKMVKKDLFVK